MEQGNAHAYAFLLKFAMIMLLIQSQMAFFFPQIFPVLQLSCMLMIVYSSPFQDPGPALNEVTQPSSGTDYPSSFTSINKSSSAYPSTTIVNPTIVLLQHNRGKEISR